MGAGKQVRRLVFLSSGAFFFLLSISGNAENRVWTEATSGEPGQVVTVVVKGENDTSLGACFVNFAFDTKAFFYAGRDFSFSPIAQAAEIYGGREEPEAGELLIQIRLADNDPTNTFPPADDFEIARIYLQVRPDCEPGSYAAGAVKKVSMWIGITEFVTPDSRTVPVEVTGGVVTVLPPTRPRPPSDLVCSRTAWTAKLQWRNLEQYDRVVVERDGRPIADLAGGEQSYLDQEAGRESHTYAVRAYVGEQASFSVFCTVPSAVSALPGVEKLTCTRIAKGTELKWRLGAEYDSIEIRRNGGIITSLEGGEISYLDDYQSDKFTLYEVIGHKGDLSSPPVPCQVNGSWVLRVGSVRAGPGAKGVEVPIYLSNPWPVVGFTLVLTVDESAFRVTGINRRGTALEELQPYLEILREGEGYYLVSVALNAPNPGRTIRPGVEVCFYKFILEISDDAQEGEIYPLMLVDGFHEPPAKNILVGEINYRGATSVRPEKIQGELVIGEPQTKGVVDLHASPEKAESGLTLRWLNGEGYDSIEIERNGQVAASLPGNSTAWTDEFLDPGIYWYRVRGIKDGAPSPWAVLAQPLLPGVSLFRRGDANANGEVNLADGITVLLYLYQGRDLGCLDAADVNDDGEVDLSDAISLFFYLFARKGPPPAPGPAVRWVDPTPDLLTCEEGTP